jgi:hypothetical protein
LLALPSRNLKRLMPELKHIRCQRDQVLIGGKARADHREDKSRDAGGDDRHYEVAREFLHE